MFIHEYHAYSEALDKLVLLTEQSRGSAEEAVATMNESQVDKTQDWRVITRINQVTE